LPLLELCMIKIVFQYVLPKNSKKLHHMMY
jgi:hypothetical protein